MTAYDRLTEILKAKGGAMPLVECEELSLLLRELYAEQDAEFIAGLPLTPFSAESLAQVSDGHSVVELSRKLEHLADATVPPVNNSEFYMTLVNSMKK